MSVPSVFGLPHLSEDAVAAFADGVLAPTAASRAARHCAECPECADAVRGQRETALTLRSAATPCLPMGLLDRLAGVPMSAPLPPPSRGLPTTLGADGVPVFVTFRPNDTPADTRTELADPNPAADGDEAPGRPAPRQAHPSFRRAALPMGLIASAAAVVAAGTLSGQVQSVADNGRQNVPAANIGGAFGSGRTSSSAPAGSTSGTLPSTVPVRSGTVLSFPESASLTTGKPVTLQSRSFRVSSHLGGMTPAP
ncbi:MAG: hypothetical protein QOH56_2778 [Pseudonocardiales bacterium]|nr:hypothetical protein [Pseudonocardiales bacterium]